jgi:hypothetical protein
MGPHSRPSERPADPAAANAEIVGADAIERWDEDLSPEQAETLTRWLETGEGEPWPEPSG